MIVIRGSGRTTDGQPVLVIGLTPDDIAGLMFSQPIVFNANDIGMSTLEVVLVMAADEEHVARRIMGPAYDAVADPSAAEQRFHRVNGPDGPTWTT